MPSPHQTQSLPRGCEVLPEKTDRKKIRKFWLWIDPFNEDDLENLFLSFSGEWEVVSRAGCPGPQCPDFLSASCKSRALLLVEVMCPLIHVHCSASFNGFIDFCIHCDVFLGTYLNWLFVALFVCIWCLFCVFVAFLFVVWVVCVALVPFWNIYWEAGARWYCRIWQKQSISKWKFSI